MFIPADGLYQDLLNNKVGALKINQRDLVSYAYQKKVMIVSPMSLFPMLQVTNKALNNMKVEDDLLEELFEGVKKFKIEATPTLIINGKKFENASNYKKLKKYLEKLI